MRTALAAAGILLFGAPGGAQEKSKAAADGPWVGPGVAHPGFDQIYWVPTGAQAEEMSKATGRLIFAVGYCADWEGY